MSKQVRMWLACAIVMLAASILATVFWLNVPPPQRHPTVEVQEVGGAIEKSLELQNERVFLIIEAGKFGLTVSLPSEIRAYKKIQNRLHTNADLVTAIKSAASQAITVSPSDRFYIGSGFVEINVDATDQEIIDFLLGKKE